jgi:hypothetical protein
MLNASHLRFLPDIDTQHTLPPYRGSVCCVSDYSGNDPLVKGRLSENYGDVWVTRGWKEDTGGPKVSTPEAEVRTPMVNTCANTGHDSREQEGAGAIADSFRESTVS